jgi:hypothetical protein
MPDQKAALRLHKASETATRATGSRSQFTVPARMIPGASASMAASQGRVRCATAVASTATTQHAKSMTTFTSKKARALPSGVMSAAIHMNSPVKAGYSSTCSVGRSLM